MAIRDKKPRDDQMAVELSDGIVTVCDAIHFKDDGKVSCEYGQSPAPTWDHDEVEYAAPVGWYEEVRTQPEGSPDSRRRSPSYVEPWDLMQ